MFLGGEDEVDSGARWCLQPWVDEERAQGEAESGSVGVLALLVALYLRVGAVYDHTRGTVRCGVTTAAEGLSEGRLGADGGRLLQ